MNKRISIRRGLPKTKAAFSLIELLVVISVIAVMAVLSGPALRGLTSAGSVSRAIADLSGTLESARAYAMAHRTYVRLAIAPISSAGGSRLNPATVVMVICPADGTLNAAGGKDMEDGSKWPALARPLVLDNLLVYDDINGTKPATTSDVRPSDTSIEAFRRKVGSIQDGSQNPKFQYFIQFNPNGEAGIHAASPERFITLALDQPVPGDAGKAKRENPFLVRLSGINGTVTVLRQGEGI